MYHADDNYVGVWFYPDLVGINADNMLTTISIEKSKSAPAQLIIQSLPLSRTALVMNSHPLYLLDNGQELMLYKNAGLNGSKVPLEWHPDMESDAHLVQQMIHRLNRVSLGILCDSASITAGSESAHKFNKHLIEDHSRSTAIYLQKPLSLAEYVDIIKKTVLEKMKSVL